MANTLLTPDMITKEALRVLHEKLTFLGNVNREYDSSFAKSGAKIGSALRVRKPARYVATDGATFVAQNTVEENTTLTVDRQKHVGMSFTSEELTMSLDDFSNRIIEPAMAALANAIEVDVLDEASGASAVPGSGTAGVAVLKDYLTAQAFLDNLTTPRDNSRCILLDTLMQVDLIDELKGIFQSADQIGKQYREGVMGKAIGADFYQSSRIPLTETVSVSTSAVAITNIGTNAITISGAGTTDTIVKGTQFALDSVFAVHPESKKVLTQAYYVTVQEDVTMVAGAGILAIAESIVGTAVAGQNVSGVPTAMTVLSQGKAKSLVFHKDAFTFATADLRLPRGTDMAARQSYDGVSLRLISDYTMSDDSFGTRIDVLYGFKTLRPEYAAVVYKSA